MRGAARVAAFAVVFCCVRSASAAPEPSVLFPGDAPPFAQSISAGWFAVCLDSAAALAPVTLSAKTGAGKKPVVASTGCKTPVVFLRGAAWLAAGPLETVTVDKQEASAKIGGGEKETNLWVTAEEPNGPHLNVERGGLTQFFWTQPKALWDQWEVVWAGDIDADGLPDFVTRAWSEEEVDLHNARALFLSSLADPEELYDVIGGPFERPAGPDAP